MAVVDKEIVEKEINVQTYDCIIVGAGGIGSAAFYHATKQGLKTLALDRFSKAHDRGSSHGQTRIIRQGYFEHPNYVPMVLESYRLWEELESETGTRLKTETGLLEIGPPEGTLISGILDSARTHGIAVDQYSNAEAKKRFPSFHIPENSIAIFERQAGYLAVEKCVATHIDRAIELGGRFEPGTVVLEIVPNGQSIDIKTEAGSWSAGCVVVAGGAWSKQLLPSLSFEIKVVYKHQHWFEPPSDHWRIDDGAPVFFYDLNGEYFYGIPAIDERGIKLAEHSGRKLVTDPTNINRSIDPEDEKRVLSFAKKYLGFENPKRNAHSVCMYSLTDDEHFIVDRHPEHKNLIIATGMSGHGFKFAPSIGQYVSQLVVDNDKADNQTFKFLKLDRF